MGPFLYVVHVVFLLAAPSSLARPVCLASRTREKSHLAHFKINICQIYIAIDIMTTYHIICYTLVGAKHPPLLVMWEKAHPHLVTICEMCRTATNVLYMLLCCY